LNSDASRGAPANAAPTCINCGAIAVGAYCPACGQETDVRLPTLQQFMRETMGSLVAIDGRLWRTLHALLTRPGFLTREYLRGRRRYYVRPARLYLATSLILFAVLRLTAEPIRFAVLPVGADGTAVAEGAAATDAKRGTEGVSGIALGGDPRIRIDLNLRSFLKDSRNVVADQLRARLEHFDGLPAHEKGRQLSTGLIQYGPYAMFVLLPVFAWLQQVSYTGRQRPYPGRPKRYVEHLVYATYLHSVMFLAAVVALLIPWVWPRWLILAWLVVYVLRSKHAIYGGSRWGGIVRTLFVVVAYSAFMAIALLLLIVPAVLLA
jgi:hypothetical protein